MPTTHHRPATLLDLLEQEAQRTDIDLGRAYVHADPGCELLALPLADSPAEIWISDHDAQLDEPLTGYTGLIAHLEPQGYGGDPDISVELYGSASLDATADVRRLLGVLLPLLAAHTVADLLLAFLDLSGISTGVQVREGCIEGVPVGLPDGAHLFVTDITGSCITHPLAAHAGLLVLRYDGEDHASGRVVYDSQRADAVADVLAAVATITAHIRQGTNR